MLKLPDNRIYVPNSGKRINSIFVPSRSPVPTITWMKVNGYIPSKSRLRKSQAVLEIPNVQLDDAGIYECRAENSRGKNSFRGQLQVYSKCFQQSMIAVVPKVKLKVEINFK